jgi:3-hydroxybutyrate dehydrogenase
MNNAKRDQRVAIVTGAAGGLGAAICSALENQNMVVVPVDLQGNGALHLDVATDDGNRAMVEAALATHGRLDVLVLNAAVQHVSPIPDFSVAQWDRLMDTMLKGPFLAIKHAWSALTARPGGRIVVTASTSSYVAEPYKAAYVAAKHGVLGLVKVAAVEGGPHGLTANAVAPALMLTGLIERQLPDQMRIRGCTRDEVIQGWVVRQPIKRPVETSEVASVVAFLASLESSGITGSCIPVDLGRLICEE